MPHNIMIRQLFSPDSMHARQLRWISTTHLVRNAVHGDGGNVTNHSSSRRASDFLWESAEQEKREEEERMTNLSGGASSSNSRIANAAASAAQEYPNWTGDESIQDAVLRMLVDKYKPLRNESIRTAEEKIKEDLKPNAHLTTASLQLESIPSGSGASSDLSTSSSPSTPSPSTDTHKPWLTTFRPPSNVASVKYMRLPPPIPVGTRAKDSPSINPDDTRSKMIERDRKKKTLLAGRLTNAKEGSLDYRIGKTSSARAANPVSLKGWNSLVEERIERARNEGVFRSIKGRGKPIVRTNEEYNPFISREEFLMNRIVQRQGAAPPWVEFQAELESAITTFRNTLRSTWIRRAVRTLTTTNHPAFLSSITLKDITRLRDPEWEKREQGYHDQFLTQINSLVRKYNGVAPYAVRKTPLDRRVELERMYEECKKKILEEIRHRASGGQAGNVDFQPRGYGEDEDGREGAMVGNGDLHDQSGRITPSKSMFSTFSWRGMWSRIISLVNG